MRDKIRFFISFFIVISIFLFGCNSDKEVQIISSENSYVVESQSGEEVLDTENTEEVKPELSINALEYTRMNGRDVDDLMDDLYATAYTEPVMVITALKPDGDLGVIACLTDGDAYKFDEYYFDFETEESVTVWLYFPQKIKDISMHDQTGYNFEENYDGSHTMGNDQFFGSVHQVDVSEDKDYFQTYMKTLSLFSSSELYDSGRSFQNNECMLGRQFNITALGNDDTEYSLCVYIENKEGLSAKPEEINLYENLMDFELDYYYFDVYTEPMIIISNENDERRIVYSNETIILSPDEHLSCICVPEEAMRVAWSSPTIDVSIKEEKVRFITGSKEYETPFTITAYGNNGEEYVFNISRE